MVDVLVNHWEPLFDDIAGQYGLTEASLRDDFSLSLESVDHLVL